MPDDWAQSHHMFCSRLVLLVLLVTGLAAVAGLATPALAVQPDEILKDPKLEARARNISAGLRCLVCQNQSIDDSDAPLAADLRKLVRERLKKGDSDAQVIKFITDRYGSFVLLNPPFGWHTFLLWFAPALLLLIGGFLAKSLFFRPATPGGAVADKAGLSDEEQAALQALLGENSEPSAPESPAPEPVAHKGTTR